MPCPLCKTDKTYTLRVGIRDEPERRVYACHSCRLQFLLPDTLDIREYYRNGYRKTHGPLLSVETTAEERFKIYRPFAAITAADIREQLPKGASILEIGCSSGYLLDALQKDYDVYGNEWNPEDAAYVRDVGELPCEEGDISEVYPGKRFTAIVATAVIEHQPDPVGWLSKVKERLIGGGWLYLETPNANDALVAVFDFPEFRDFWYRAPHLTYWEMENMAAALSSVGFQARISIRQKYGLLNHLSWMMDKKPMSSFVEAAGRWRPVASEHPMAPVLNRWFDRLDREYRVQMETLRIADTITVWARRREI